jgi:hypothetical protein
MGKVKKIKKVEKISPAVYERHCRNCGELVAAGKHYCGNCGAKWIENRITMRNVANDFSDMYLGFDTKFVRTFVDLFRKPEDVINGYIDGRRAFYVDAIRYTLVAIFLAGIYVLVLKNIDPQFVSFNGDEIYRSLGYTDDMIKQVNESNQRFTSYVYDYQGVFMLASIPIYAFIARITFWSKRRFFNFTEHIVFYLYTAGQSSIVSSVISLILLAIDIKYFVIWMYLFVPSQVAFTAYCYKRVFNLTIGGTALRTLKFLFVFVSTYLVVAIVGALIGIFLKLKGFI